MIPRARLKFLARLSLIPAGLTIMLLSGFVPFESFFTSSKDALVASIAAYDVANLTNDQRTQNGLPRLAVSALLTEAAQQKANHMAQNSYYAHVSPDGKTPLYWLDKVGYRYQNAGENLVIDRTTSEDAVDAWMHSQDHRDNILRPQFTEIGVGVAKGEYDGQSTIFVVQEFGKPYPQSIPVKPKQVAAAPAASKPVTPTTAVAVAAPKATKAPAIPKVSTPHIATLSKPKPATPKAPVQAESTAATTTAEQATSTVTFALAPEFYTPVTLTAGEAAKLETQPAAPKAESVSSFSIFVANVKAFFGSLFSRPS